MKTFWSLVAKGGAWLVHYAVEHPDQAVAVVQAIADAKKGKS